MEVAGLVVGGGVGERMSRSGGLAPKPLMLVRGVTLLERNVFALLGAGITDIHVAVSAKADVLIRFAQSRCHKMAEAVGACLSVIAEHQPLGTIGPAAFLRNRDTLLVVNADNLTSLDLRAILNAHEVSGAALTLAVHDQPFPIPFGEVAVEGDRVVAYLEKPTLVVPICSAISVLGPAALASLQRGEHLGLPAFVNRLLSHGADVRAFHHNAPWIDVNDRPAVERAEALVAAHPDQFELWAGQHDHDAVAVIFFSHRGVAFERGDDGTWCLPAASMEIDENPLSTAARVIEDRVAGLVARPRLLTVFDDIDTVRGGVTRIRVFSVDLIDETLLGSASWIRAEDIGRVDELAPAALRALTAWGKH